MILSNQIRQKYELSHVLHMTDFMNLESILSHGGILSHNQVISKNVKIEDISNESVQCGRANIIVSCTGRPLHDYVPLYWGRKTPMVSALRERNESLLFLMFSTEILFEQECVISDGNARSNNTVFAKYTQLSDLDLLSPKYINSAKYAFDEEVKRRKQAELLVLDKLPLKRLEYIVCFTPDVKNSVKQLLTTHSVKCGVYVGGSNYYY